MGCWTRLIVIDPRETEWFGVSTHTCRDEVVVYLVTHTLTPVRPGLPCSICFFTVFTDTKGEDDDVTEERGTNTHIGVTSSKDTIQLSPSFPSPDQNVYQDRLSIRGRFSPIDTVMSG